MDKAVLAALFIALLIIINGIFSAGEFAIVSSRKSKIKEIAKKEKDRRVDDLLEMKENPERFLSAVQIGITLCGTLASAIGGILSVQYVKPFIRQIPYIGVFDETISVIIVVVVLTYLFLVVGELVPKYIGINYREKVALFIAPLMHFIAKVFFVFVNLLSFSTLLIVKALNLKRNEDHVGEGEIKVLLEEGRRKGVFDETEEKLIHGVFEFADRSVKEVMVPRPNVYSINIEDGNDDIVKYVVENEFSRYPVYRENLDKVIGIVFQKDIAKQIWLQSPFSLEKLLKKPYFVPETMGISVLLKEMQKRRQHLAIVVDEYGTTVGIVTLEDIMEEIFGEIMDETDVDDRIERLKDGSVIIDASYSIRDLNNRFHLDLAESPDYETLGGFILTQLQEIPKGGEIILQGPHRFTVVGLEGRRITKVKLDRPKRV
ncbi:MAG TPA: hemolysin family protein [Syntrophorhabdaceae bacterium]|nr:hemolysin family protein [Syntrophorhabdaceae bacterium]HQM80920.1 hemolysin family protein [Syntrophorhabdaceae bacterium]